MQKELGIVTDKGLVLDEQSLESLKNKNVSASAITGLEGCAASWGFKTFYSSELKEDKITDPNILGNIFHNSLELFYKTQKENRTLSFLQECVHKTLSEHPLVLEFEGSEQAQNWVKKAIQNYVEYEPDYQNINIALLETKYGTKPALEYFITNKIGNSTRNIVGFVDRIIQNDNNTITVQDYKTGKVKEYDTYSFQGNGMAEARQQTLYAILLEKQGLQVDKTQLLFPIAQKTVEIKHESEKFRQKCVKDVENTSVLMDDYTENNLLPFKPSVLCAWCPLAKICVQKDIKNNNKCKTAYNSQPDKNKLEKIVSVE